MIGFILFAVGAAKAGILGRLRAAALAVGILLPFGFISGYIVVSVIGFALVAVALVPLGAAALRSGN